MAEAAVERLGLRARRALWAAAVVVCAVGVGAAQEPPVKVTPAEWDQAMAAVRGISLDSDQPAPRRANAIVAYAKLSLLRGRPDDAVKLCREILSTASAGEVAIAAVRAGTLTARYVHCHLGAAGDFVQTWQGGSATGSARAAADRVQQDLAKIRQHLMSVAGRNPVPMPIAVGLASWAALVPGHGARVLGFPAIVVAAPHWSVSPPGGAGPSVLAMRLPPIPLPPQIAKDGSGCPAALRLTLPAYVAPPWYAGVSFPPLKEAPKK